jgi:hypothetical protein
MERIRERERTRSIPGLAAPALGLWLGACTLVQVDPADQPARLEASGLVSGHAAVGVRDEDHILQLGLFEGTSDGALAEIVIWRLFRAEVGLAGASLGIGPFDLGLGLGFYAPRVPRMIDGEEDEVDHRPAAEVLQVSSGAGG